MDYYALKAMEMYGSSFIQALAKLIRVADTYNRNKIREGWGEEIEKYKTMGKKLQERENG